jgi:hypothetical protein
LEVEAESDLSRVLGAQEFLGTDVVSCMSGDRIDYRRVAFEGGSDGVSVSLIHDRIARERDAPRGDLRVDAFDIPPRHGGAGGVDQCIAVVASSSDVDRHASMLRGAGLTPIAMDTTAGAIARCVSTREANGEESATLIIEIGSMGRTMVIVRNDSPVFATSVRDARHRRVSSLQGGGVADGADEAVRASVMDLAAELNSLVQYVMEEDLVHLLPRRGVMLGAGELEGVMLEALSERTHIEFVPLEATLRPLARSIRGMLPGGARLEDMVVPLGLSLYGHEHLAEAIGS